MLARIEEEEDVQVWKSLGFSGRVSDPLVVLIYLTYYIAMGNQHFSWLGVGLYIYIIFINLSLFFQILNINLVLDAISPIVG